MSEALLALGIDRAKCDTDKALVLDAIKRFADSVGDAQLVAEVQAAMPRANPFFPPDAWKREYDRGFYAHADGDRGTYVEEWERYCVEYWQQQLTDADRQARFALPSVGRDDGRKDAEALNAA